MATLSLIVSHREFAPSQGVLIWPIFQPRFIRHVPAIGAALDRERREPYWQPLFKGYEFSKQWMQEAKPDVIISTMIMRRLSVCR